METFYLLARHFIWQYHQKIVSIYCNTSSTNWQVMDWARMGIKDFYRFRKSQIFRSYNAYNILTTFTISNFCCFASTFTRCNPKGTTVWVSLSMWTANWIIKCWGSFWTFWPFLYWDENKKKMKRFKVYDYFSLVNYQLGWSCRIYWF